VVRVGGLNAFLLAAVVAPPDPITQGLSAAGGFVVAVPAVYAVARLGERDTRP
jgi:Sec-independent protein secretion pathway component TatC